MQLWGSAIDASKAKPYELPEEEDQYPEDPLNTGQGQATPSNVATSDVAGATSDPLSPTKAYVKPTVHLPDDHAEATGEAHSSFGEAYPTPSPNPIEGDVKDPSQLAEEEEEHDVSIPSSEETGKSSSLYDQTPGYLAGLSTLVGSTTWLFVAFGTIVIFVAGATAFLVLRRRRSKAGAGNGGRGAFDFLPQSDFDDDDEGERVPMSAMERGRLRLGDDEGGRTRELFNAFALNSEDEDDESDSEGRHRVKRSTEDVAYSDRGVRCNPFSLSCVNESS